MTNQEKRAYLGRYLDNEREIKRTEEELLHWESLAEKITTSYSGLSGRGGKGDRIQVAVERIAEWRDTLVLQMESRIRLAQEIERTIETIPEERLRLILRCKYINGWTFGQIAAEMNYSRIQISRLHTQALSKMMLNDT